MGWKLCGLEEREHAALFGLFLDKHLEVLEDDGDSQQNTRTRTDGTHKVGHDGQRTDTHATESSGDRDVTFQDDNQRLITETLHDHTLIPELFGHIFGRRTRDFNPRLGEEGTGRQDKREIEQRMNGIGQDFRQRGGRRHIIRQNH